ncbi:MAG: Hpt domain-containing protein [Chloroflexi bacterium]|nr:Hpt domain-containing protein [Chloroflexota bacterium]
MTESNPQVLNEAVLEELEASVQGDRAFIVDLIETYLADGASHMVDVVAAMTAGDASALVRPAHTLKSSSATVGAERLAAMARRLEAAGRSGVIEAGLGDEAARLDVAWDEAADALRGWIRRGEDT